MSLRCESGIVLLGPKTVRDYNIQTNFSSQFSTSGAQSYQSGKAQVLFIASHRQ